MGSLAFALTLAAWLPVRQLPAPPVLEGVVVNATRPEAPVARTEVMLRAGAGNSLQQVATTMTDAQGRFTFCDVPVDANLVYLAGANHRGIHYPGPRLQLAPGRPPVPVTLTVYDTATSPSPLTAEKHTIDIHVYPALLDITETLWIANASLTTFIGAADEEGFAETLRLAIPDSFQRVTFHQEFFGRRFKVGHKCIITDIPWTPGKREVKFTYQLPVTATGPRFERRVDLPCVNVRLRVFGDDLQHVECSLPRIEDSADVVFGSADERMAPGETIRLQLAGAARLWHTSARWIGLSALAVLILATAAYSRLRTVLRQSSGRGYDKRRLQHVTTSSK